MIYLYTTPRVTFKKDKKFIGPSRGPSQRKIENPYNRFLHLSGIVKVLRKQMIKRVKKNLQFDWKILKMTYIKIEWEMKICLRKNYLS